MEVPRRWWQSAVIYQIYPASFKDSDSDGLGDIPGIISKVGYLKALGVDALWLSPCFKSPQVDMGYDISDYKEIHAPYGTVADVETLIAELKKNGMKLLMDLVVNHTSDEHPWFLESKSSLKTPKRDWYIWKKGTTKPNGEKMPPNNWQSIFKGSTWTYDETTDEWYFHIFAAAQPDLNWNNPEVRAAVADVVDFWLQKGLGGYRVDAINLISKPQDFADVPATQSGYYQVCMDIIKNRPEVHEWLRELKRNVLDKYDDLLNVGECGGTYDIDDTLKYIQPEREELDIIFQFELQGIDVGTAGVFSPRAWDIPELKRIVDKWQHVLRPAWNTLHMENHDMGRSVNRYSRTTDPGYYPAASKLFACFMMTVGSTVFLHQGQELGAQNLPKSIELRDYLDLATHGDFHQIREDRIRTTGNPYPDMSDTMKEVQLKARDHARIPMAWDSSDGAGFSTGKPWMMLNTDYKEVNVAAQDGVKESVLSTWRDMIAFRKQYPEELVYGDFELVDPYHQQVFAYWRIAAKDKGGAKVLVVMNWSDQSVVQWILPTKEPLKQLKLIGKIEETGDGKMNLQPYACVCWQA